jgi:hypothetical protein
MNKLTIIKIIISSFILCLLISSCSNSEKENQKHTGRLNYDEAFSIFQSQYLIEPDTVYLSNVSNYFAAEDLKYITILKYFGKTWQEYFRYEKPLPRIIHDVDWTVIDSIPYIYFVNEESGNTFGEVKFHMISLVDANESYSIEFEGRVGKYDKINAPISTNLKSNKSILNYLETKISNSQLVYRPSKEDLDINYFKNYENKWLLENQDIYTSIKRDNEYSSSIKFIYYDEDLFNDITHGSEAASIENENFTIKSFFKDIVIGYNKHKKEFFVIWVPEFSYDWIKEARFGQTTNSILIFNDSEEYKINLVSGELKYLQKKE